VSFTFLFIAVASLPLAHWRFFFRSSPPRRFDRVRTVRSLRAACLHVLLSPDPVFLPFACRVGVEDSVLFYRFLCPMAVCLNLFGLGQFRLHFLCFYLFSIKTWYHWRTFSSRPSRVPCMGFSGLWVIYCGFSFSASRAISPVPLSISFFWRSVRFFFVPFSVSPPYRGGDHCSARPSRVTIGSLPSPHLVFSSAFRLLVKRQRSRFAYPPPSLRLVRRLFSRPEVAPTRTESPSGYFPDLCLRM